MSAARYDVAVLGAGVIGISCAYYLAKLQLRVLLIEQGDEVCMGAARANGGQISCCHAKPWAAPDSIVPILQYLANPQAPLYFKPRWDVAQWRYLAGFLYQCLPRQHLKNTEQILKLALFSRSCLQQIRAEHGIEYQQQTLGILHFYQNRKVFAKACQTSALMQSLGLARQPLNAQEVLAHAPALAPIADKIAGGTFTASDESGNALLFCQAMLPILRQMGVEFAYNSTLANWQPDASAQLIDHANHTTRRIVARDTIVAMGAHSANWLRALGIRINVYPAKGYSWTLPVLDPARAPQLSLTDDEHKLVISRMGANLRIAGTAELSGYDLSLNPARLDFIRHKAQQYFADALDYQNATPWAGLRPCTASSVPIIRQSRHANLWINTGHGTLGFTMAAGSGKLLADKIAAARGIQPQDF